MRLAVLSFLLLINLHCESKALNIKDIEIENVKIGDSIFDHFDKRHVTINEKIVVQGYNSKRYIRNEFKILSPKKYANIAVHYNKDKIIGAVNGTILYHSNSERCAKKEKEVLNDILTFISNKAKTRGRPGDKNRFIKYPDSYYTSTSIFVDGGSIRITCTYWGKKIKKKHNWVDSLRVVLQSDDFINWVNYEAYK